MITNKDAKEISSLFNRILVDKMMIASAFEKDDQEDVRFWMDKHNETALELHAKFKIEVVMY
jgi:hypothetical protein